MPGLGGAGDNGGPSRNVPKYRVIGGPIFRDPTSDYMLLMAGHVTHALLWREEDPATAQGQAGLGDVFTVLE